MKKYLLIISFLLLTTSVVVQAQSVFEEYGIETTNLGAAPFSNLSLEAMDYNSAGSVFLREGVELSLNSLWPRWQKIENKNSFDFKGYEVNRVCTDYSKGGVPNPSARLSWRFGDNAVSFSYNHGESVMEGDGNSNYDEVVQRVVPQHSGLTLSLMSLLLSSANENINYEAAQAFQQYGVEIQPLFPEETKFPITLLSKETQYGCRTNRFSLGYSRRFDVGSSDSWEYISLYGGMKYQNIAMYQKTFIDAYCYDFEHQMPISVQTLCEKFSDCYRDMADRIPDMYEQYDNMAKSYEELGRSFDTMYSRYQRSSEITSWGINAILGFNWVRPYCNFASQLEFGTLPCKFSMGYSQYLGRWQLSVGGDVGYADANYGAYSKLFHKQLGFDLGNYWYGDLGTDAAYRFPKTNLTLKAGGSFGINKDVLLNNGYSVLLKKHNVLSPSFGVDWQITSLFTLIGGFRVQIPVNRTEIVVGGGTIDSNAICVVKPEYHVAIGFVAHLL